MKDFICTQTKFIFVQNNVHASLKIWNKAPLNIHKLFKIKILQKIKEYLLDNPYYSLN